MPVVSDIFQAFDRGRNPRNEILNDQIYLVIVSAFSPTLLKEDSKTQNKMCIYTNYKCDIWESERSLNFSFILLPCPIVVTRMCQPTVCYAVHLWKTMPHAMFWLIQTFYEWKIHWTFPLLYIIAISFVWHVCPSDFACPLGHYQCCAFILECFVRRFFFFNLLIQITRRVPCIQKRPVLVHSWIFLLLIFTSCVQLQPLLELVLLYIFFVQLKNTCFLCFFVLVFCIGWHKSPKVSTTPEYTFCFNLHKEKV